jgi:hypothetical protein
LKLKLKNGGQIMTRKMLAGNSTRAQVNITLPVELLDDLNKIITNNETNLHELIYSYIIQGMTSDAFAYQHILGKKTSKGI